MPSIRTSIGMQKLLNKFITGQNNIPFITVLHRKGRFVFRPSDDRGCAYIPPPGLPSSKNSMDSVTSERASELGQLRAAVVAAGGGKGARRCHSR